MSSGVREIGTDSNRSERSRRTIKKSQKARESDEHIPGLSSSSANTTPAGSPRRLAAMPSPKGKGHASTSNGASIPVPSFSPDPLMIYNWPIPRPKTFTDLPNHLKAWKQQADTKQQAQDIDDGSDDWYDFSGNRIDYVDHRGDGFALEYCVANAFVHRAKRAFWAGASWQHFEIQERSINSEAQARAEPDAKKRATLLEEALDNNRRLAVFNALKHRLCEEIWLERYQLSRDVLSASMTREDSKMGSQAPAGPARNSHLTLTAQLARAPAFDPHTPQRRRPPTTAEARRGITGWQVDGFKGEQPLYRTETETPAGMRDFMRGMREQAQSEARTKKPRERGRVGNVGVGGVVAMMAAEEIAARELDFSTSEEEAEEE